MTLALLELCYIVWTTKRLCSNACCNVNKVFFCIKKVIPCQYTASKLTQYITVQFTGHLFWPSFLLWVNLSLYMISRLSLGVIRRSVCEAPVHLEQVNDSLIEINQVGGSSRLLLCPLHDDYMHILCAGIIII